MKNKTLYILLPGLLACSLSARASDKTDDAGTPAFQDHVALSVRNNAGNYVSGSSDIFDRSPDYDIAKALYGTIPGLVVSQGEGSMADNVSSLSIHGFTPLVLIDGIPRNIDEITSSEIESVTVLKDAVAASLYGVKGANGALLITTKRGESRQLEVTARYQFGLSTMYRAPEFSDAFTYANSLNEALILDGLSPKYTAQEVETFRTGVQPYLYPDVDWMKEIYNDIATNHRMNLTFNGGSQKFRYYAVVDYMYDTPFYRNQQTDDRYDARFFNTNLGLRANIDVDITPTTFMKLGVMARLAQKNESNCSNIETVLYTLPAAAFPVRYEDGIYGGSLVHKDVNPVGMLNDKGAYASTSTTVLADLNLRQNLDVIVDGLSADVTVAFDYLGGSIDTSSKEYRYKEMNPYMLQDGTIVTKEIVYGKDSQTLGHSSWLTSFVLRSEMQAKLNYGLDMDSHHVDAHAIYRQRSYATNPRNASFKNQEAIVTANYNYGDRYFINAVANWGGTSYLKKGERFNFYPAVSIGWLASNEDFLKTASSVLSYLKLSASAGKSGYDGNMEHELYLQTYGNDNAFEYPFTVGASPYWGQAEGNLPVENLTPEESLQFNISADAGFFADRLKVFGQFFMENRSKILVAANNVSQIIGIGINRQNIGEMNYMGADFGLSWRETIGKIKYGIYANGTYLTSEIIEDGQAFQKYDYLYHKGNRVGQCYGLEVTGIFQNQYEINNSPKQTFSTVKPGDLKYKDQNNDGVIDDEDVVKMFGSTLPRFNFGFGFNFSYDNFEVSADFQGRTGVTVNLLSSPLYQPLVSNATISDTFLDREVAWTPEKASEATMPRLTTLENKNNYRNNSLWYRDGSFLKLRNLTLAYTFTKKKIRFADMKIYASGTNLFSLDNIGFADPEQLWGGYPTYASFWMGVKFTF